MTTVTIEIKSPELIEAINNLAKAQAANAEALNRLAGSRGPSEHVNGSASPTGPLPAPRNTALPHGPSPTGLLPPPLGGTNTANPHSSGNSLPTLPTAQVTRPSLLPSTPLPFPERMLTLDDLARAASFLMGAGKYLVLVDLLGKFGVQALFQLPTEHFGAFAAALRQLGAPI